MSSLLRFEKVPTGKEILARAELIAEYAESINAEEVLIDGSPYLMSCLIKILDDKGIRAYYPYSRTEFFGEFLKAGKVIRHDVFDLEGLIPCESYKND